MRRSIWCIATTFALVWATGCGGEDHSGSQSSCADGVRSGSETGVDCGGDSGCPSCGVSEGCVEASDCGSDLCEQGVCTCPAGMAEDGVGGACVACAAGRWGVNCAESCGAVDCVVGVECDAVDGTITACSECAPGLWGATCASACAQGDCVGTVTCDQTTGDPVDCSSCVAGTWGAGCGDSCAQGECMGTVTCDQTTGDATACGSCQPGFWGAGCASACDPGDCTGAVTCDQVSGDVTACAACAPGTWGARCDQTCDQGDCTGVVTCDQVTGAAMSCIACEPGAWGSVCDAACDQGDCTGTVTCDQTTGAAVSCTGCEAGSYGVACELGCAQGACAGAVTCDQTTGDAVSCTGCQDGSFGDICAMTCTQAGCSGTVTCAKTTGEAVTCAGCDPGFHGQICDMACAQGACSGTVTCDQATGAATACTGCAAGSYGATCELACAQGQCTGAVTCDQVSGAVVSCVSCAPGFYGPTCGDACAQGDCASVVTCDMTTGDAVSCSVCKPGFWGATCQNSCDAGDCTGDVVCDQNTGALVSCSTCDAGFWGAGCDMACAQGDCTGTVTCDQTTGAAQACTGCEAGAYGATCDLACAQGDCAGAVTCDQMTGVVAACPACAAGFYGTTCDMSCSAIANCDGDVTCDQSTGTNQVCSQCAAGFYGDTCQGCAQGNCTGTVTCDATTGAVQSCSGCVAGFHGTTCDSACAQGDCTGTVTCAQGDGAAVSCTGCADGFYGDTCDSSCLTGDCATATACDQATGAPTACNGCADGRWGPACENTCSHPGCTSVVCDQTTGVAASCGGCEGSRTGNLCDWWDPAWTGRAPLSIDVMDAPVGATEVQVPIDVDAVCYGEALPPILYSFHFNDAAADYISSLDGHGVFAPLDYGGGFTRGVEGDALHLDGVDDYVDMPNISPASHALTLSAWVRLDQVPANSPGIVSAWQNQEIYDLRVTPSPSNCHVNNGSNGGARFLAQVHPNGMGEDNLCSTTEIRADRWYFVAMTYDGQVVNLYVDGTLEATFDYGSAGTLNSGSVNVLLGTDRNFNAFLPGALDDVTLLDGALDAAGVQALMRPRCRRDGADLRVYDRDLDALLPTWTESDGRIWVRVPVDVGTHAVDLYYGNPLAPDVSDGHAVFELFDDFAGGFGGWIPGNQCSGTAPTSQYGKVRGDQDCDSLTSSVVFDDRALSIDFDVFQDAAGTHSCFDAAVAWLGPVLTASVRFDVGGQDGVGIGPPEPTGVAACGDDAGVAGTGFDAGTLRLVQPPAGGVYNVVYEGLDGAIAVTPEATDSAEKGALRLYLAGFDTGANWIDNVRVYVPTTTVIGVGDDERCADDLGVACCGHSDCGDAEACLAQACVPRYGWIDGGPITQATMSFTTCTGFFEDTATCDQDIVGEQVHIAPASTPGVNFRVIGSPGNNGILPGGSGTAASVSADGTALTWSGQSGGCVNQTPTLVDTSASWACQVIVCDFADACASGVCSDQLCQAPTCEDGVHNGAEHDIDCGGPDCDACPVVTALDVAVLDSAGAATVTFELSAARTIPVTVDFETADGSASAGTDYAATSGRVVFLPGELLATATIQVLAAAPRLTVAASDRDFSVTLLDVRGGDAGADGTVTLRDSTVRVIGAQGSDEITVVRGIGRRDIDGDGDLDLVVSSAEGNVVGGTSGAIYTLFGTADMPARTIDLASPDPALDGTGGFVVERAYRSYSQTSVGDFDGDGLGDIVANPSKDAFAIVFGGGQPYEALYDTGTAGVANLTNTGFSNGTWGVAPLDFDADGYDDAFVSGSNSSVFGATARGLAVYQGRATWLATQTPDLTVANGVGTCGQSSQSNGGVVGGVGDFDNDGYLDATLNRGCANDGQLIHFRTFVLLGNSAFTLPSSLVAVDGSDGFALTGGGGWGPRPNHQHGDFNGDGVDDALVHQISLSTRHHLIYGGAGAHAASSALSGTSAADVGVRIDHASVNAAQSASAGFGDVDGDGFDDLVLTHAADASLTIVWGRAGAGGTLTAANDPDRLELTGDAALDSAENVHIDDIDGDGLGDLHIIYNNADPLSRNDAGMGLIMLGARLAAAHNPELVLGSAVADVIDATAGADSVAAGRGDDLVGGVGAGDVVYAGQGDDTVLVTEMGFARVDGGLGMDTLSLAAPGAVLDLRAIGRKRVLGFEIFDLTAAGSQSVALNAGDATAMSPSRHLWIDGDASDGVNLDGDWVNQGDADMDGRDAWTQGGLTVHVATGVRVEAFVPGTTVTVSPSSVDEGVAGALVGTLSSDDPDTPPANIAYSLVAGAGDTDNALFVIDGTSLLVGTTGLDFENAQTHSVRVQADDGTTAWAAAITISVNDVGCGVPGECPVTDVLSARASVTCLARGAESVCWGDNVFKATGEPATSTTYSGYSHTGLPDIQRSEAGIHGSCALAGGAVYCWGTSYSGSHAAVARAGISTATSVQVGDLHICALLADETLNCWGESVLGQLGGNALTGVLQVTSNDHHNCAVLTGGEVRCWGRNNNGQLGKGSASGSGCGTGGDVCESTPVTVPGISDAHTVVTGHSFTCALRDTGSTQCWGANANGQLATGATSGNTYGPVEATALPDGTVQLALANTHGCALTDLGEVLCWGSRAFGKIGDGLTLGNALTPFEVDLPAATEVAVGHSHSCARLVTGEVRCWGQDSKGQCGNGNDGAATQLSPVTVLGVQ